MNFKLLISVILVKFFSTLWKNGTILITTSNRHPNELYKDGLNRQYFLPFIDQLQYECIVKDIGSQQDYRMMMTSKHPNTYYIPLNKQSSQQLLTDFEYDLMERRNQLLLNGLINDEMELSLKLSTLTSISIPVMMNRIFLIKKGCIQRKICWIEFNDICDAYTGAADFKAICSTFDTIYLHQIPTLSVIKHDIARRFITFIDEVYDAKIRLCWTCNHSPNKMFQELIVESDSSLETVEYDHTPAEAKSYEKITRGDNTATHSVRSK